MGNIKTLKAEQINETAMRMSRKGIPSSRKAWQIPNMSHSVRTANVDHGNGVRMCSGVAGTGHDFQVTNGLRNNSGVLSGHSNLPSVEIVVNAAAHAPEILRSA